MSWPARVVLLLLLAACSSGRSEHGGFGNVIVEVHRHYGEEPAHRDGSEGGREN